MKVEFTNAKMQLVQCNGQTEVLGRNTAVKLLLSTQPNRWVEMFPTFTKLIYKIGTKESVQCG